ncbi:MAG: UPF0146 family protein [Methanoregula sp.]|nr:UPF0146 family protein [Methanoregula sp.]
MDDYKHIEKCIGNYIASHYTRAIEIGIGRNEEAAKIVSSAGALIRCTDVKAIGISDGLPFFKDDIFSPDNSLYTGAEVIYAIRPAPEMISPLIELAGRINADLIVYHLGFESYENGGEIIDCGVLLHRYHIRQKPSNRVD